MVWWCWGLGTGRDAGCAHPQVDGHYNGSVSAAVTMVAPTISLLKWAKCPASMLHDGHYNGRVSAAVTTVSPMQSCLHVVGLGRSTSWASIERARQSAPASRAEGELHQQGCPKDASQRTRAIGREPKVASQRTRAEGREPKDASQRTRDHAARVPVVGSPAPMRAPR